MKTLLAFTLVAGCLQAFAGPENADMPYLYPDKCDQQKSIVIPQGIEGTSYYFNRNCSVAYIVPPPTASLEFSKPAVTENMRLCTSVIQNKDTIIGLYAQIAKIRKKMETVDATDPKFKTYSEAMLSLQSTADALAGSFVKTPGMTIQMQLKSSLTPEYMNAITLANMPAIEQNWIKIRPAPLQKSYLTFNNIIPGVSKTYAQNPVLESNILGILSQADESNTDRSSIRFDGGASGYVVLNLEGACPLMTGNYNSPSKLVFDAKMAGSNLTITNTMMVPAISAFGYEASLDVKNATKTLFEKFGHKGQFSSTEATNLFVTGELATSFTVNSWTYEPLTGDQQTQYGSLVAPENQQKVRAAMMEQYLAQLVQLKVLQEIKQLDTPNAGNEVHTGTQTQCWSSSSWFGLSSDSGCRDVTYQFLVPTDGTSDQTLNVQNNLGAVFQDKVEFLHPVSRIYTSTFMVKGGN